MAVVKRPKGTVPRPTAPDEQEQRIEAFIGGHEKQPGPAPATPAAEKEARARVMMRFDPSLLRRIDSAARRLGVSRTAWLHMVANRALDQGDD